MVLSAAQARIRLVIGDKNHSLRFKTDPGIRRDDKRGRRDDPSTSSGQAPSMDSG
jgi:hypothetical protein